MSSLSQIRGVVPTSLPQGLPLPSFPGLLSSYRMPHVCQYNAVGGPGYPVQWVGISGAPQQPLVIPTQPGGPFQPGMSLQAFPASSVQKPSAIPPGPKWIRVDDEERTGRFIFQKYFGTPKILNASSWVLPYFPSFEFTFLCIFFWFQCRIWYSSSFCRTVQFVHRTLHTEMFFHFKSYPFWYLIF